MEVGGGILETLKERLREGEEGQRGWGAAGRGQHGVQAHLGYLHCVGGACCTAL